MVSRGSQYIISKGSDGKIIKIPLNMPPFHSRKFQWTPGFGSNVHHRNNVFNLPHESQNTAKIAPESFSLAVFREAIFCPKITHEIIGYPPPGGCWRRYFFLGPEKIPVNGGAVLSWEKSSTG